MYRHAIKKMNKLLILFSGLIILSCNSHTDNINEVNTDTAASTVQDIEARHRDNTATITGCYMEILKRDTFAASLQQQGNIVTGKLSFDNYEKDGSNGPVTGTLDGNIMKLLYSFASEGMNSVMEVYFKYQDGKLLRGTGDMGNKGDTTYFTNPAAIKYDGSVFKKLACETLPTKYK